MKRPRGRPPHQRFDDDPHAWRFAPRAWPTRAETDEFFAGLRTTWLVPYRDRRAPIPQQHATAAYLTAPPPWEPPRRRRRTSPRVAIARPQVAASQMATPISDAVSPTPVRDEAARRSLAAWAAAHVPGPRRTPAEQTAWWVEFLVGWVTRLWERVGTERLTAQRLGRQMKALAMQLVVIDFRKGVVVPR